MKKVFLIALAALSLGAFAPKAEASPLIVVSTYPVGYYQPYYYNSYNAEWRLHEQIRMERLRRMEIEERRMERFHHYHDEWRR